MVHYHEPLVPGLPITTLRLHRGANVGTFHAMARRNLGYYYGRPFLVRYFRRLHGRICVSEPAREFISHYFPGDYTIVPNGIDGHRFRPDLPPLPGAARRRRGDHPLRRQDGAAQGSPHPARGLRAAAPAGGRLPPGDRRRRPDALGVRASMRGDRGSRRHLPRPRHGRHPSPHLRQRRRLLLAGHRQGELRHRPAGGDGQRVAGGGVGDPRLQPGRRARRRRAAGAAGPARRLRPRARLAGRRPRAPAQPGPSRQREGQALRLEGRRGRHPRRLRAGAPARRRRRGLGDRAEARSRCSRSDSRSGCARGRAGW